MDETAPKSGNGKLIILAVAVIALLAIAAFFFLTRGDNNTTPAATDTQNNTNQSPTNPAAGIEETMSEGDVVEVDVTNQGFAFDTKEIRVNQGDTVRVTYTSAGGTHDWVVDEFDARTEVLNSGESETVEFVADQAGTFEYYCSVGNHRQMGMVGNLIVE